MSRLISKCLLDVITLGTLDFTSQTQPRNHVDLLRTGLHLENFVKGGRWAWHLHMQHIAFLLPLSSIIFSSLSLPPVTNNIAFLRLNVHLFLSLSLPLSPSFLLFFWGGGGGGGELPPE